ncbi:MAG: PAS domain S-box protein [Planctomycetes bacterium]|nr:PAS domain S-box protein [Planctomycetota bacterium]
MKNVLGILGRKLLFYFVSLSLIPAVILCYINYLHSKKLLETELFNELSLIGAALTEHINIFLITGVNSAKHYSSDGFIRDHLEKISNTPEKRPLSEELSKYLKYKTGLEQKFRETFIINPLGIVIASSDTLRVGADMSDDLNTLSKKGNTFVKDAYFCDLTGECSLIFYSSVIHKDTNNFLGMIGIRILASELDTITVGNMQEIQDSSSEKETSVTPQASESSAIPYSIHYTIRPPTELVTLTRRGKTSEAYLVNKNRLMLTSSRFTESVQLNQKVDTLPVHVMDTEKNVMMGIYSDYRNIAVIGVSKQIPSMDWLLLVETDLSEALEPVYRIRNYSIIIITISAAIISALAFFISKNIINPITLLMTAIGNVSRGIMGKQVQVTSGDEIGKLTSDFNRMNSELMTTRDELRNLFDAANDPMVTLKEGNKINNMNARVSELLGYSHEDLLQKNITDIIQKNDIQQVEYALQETWMMKYGEKYPTFEVGVLGKDGNIVICELDLNRTQFGIQPHFRNITKRKLLEQSILEEKQKLEESNKKLKTLYEELKNTQLQLFQSEKMASIGQLAAGIAHEINNPVGFISSNLELMQQKLHTFKKWISEMKLPAKDFATETPDATGTNINHNKIIKQMEDGVLESLEGTNRIKKIVGALRTFSYRGNDEFEMVDINAEIKNTLNIIHNEIKYKANLITLFGDIPHIRCNRYQLGQVFMNIIINAVQSITDYGEIRLHTGKKENTIFIEITDNGIGIPAQYISKIFEPFFTTKEVGKGTGLGLSIAYNIIKNHHGAIEVNSKVNEGTTFTIKLPIDTV